MGSDAWIALGSGIIGAVVGGVFTTVGAIQQSKALFRATAMELATSLAHERDLRNEERRERALQETLAVVLRIEMAGYDIADDHQHSPESPCDRKDARRMLFEYRAEMLRCYNVYGARLLGKAIFDSLINILELLDALCDKNDIDMGIVPSRAAHDRIPEMVRNEYCLVGQAAYCLQDACEQPHSQLQQAMKVSTISEIDR